jgi:hypothetical protein
MINLNLKRLRESREGVWFLVDMVMLLLLVANLLLLIVDALYSTDAVRQWVAGFAPGLVESYAPVHTNFLLIDLCFVAVFLTEFLLRWAIAVKHKTYLRWFFYPFIHWYDLVGCIPLGAARVFRFLRVFSIIYRLNKYGIIDVRQWAPYRFIMFYYEVLLEELTDRVIVKALSDVQDELEGNSRILQDIMQRVVYTRKETLASWVSLSLAHVGNSIERNKDGIVTQHLVDSVSEAMSRNEEVARLRAMPIVGKHLEKRLERSVADIVVSTIVNLLNDMDTEKLLHAVEKTELHAAEHGTAVEEQSVNTEMLSMMDDAIEVIKEHVNQKKWKLALDERYTETVEMPRPSPIGQTPAS